MSFPATPIQPSAFKIKKAKAKGIDLKPTPGIELTGIQFLPESAERAPAIILLVSGDGLTTSHLAWAKTLSDAGYVALVVDSFGARGGKSYQDTPSLNMPDDAYSAFRYLAARPDVDAGRIGLLGFSLGGSHIFTTIAQTNSRIPAGFAPFSAVSIYPTCPPDGTVTIPLLILAGDADSLMSLRTCEAFVAQTQSHDNPIDLHVYPGATHFFDNPSYLKEDGKPAPTPKPFWFDDNHYDAMAHADAVDRVLGFFAASQP